MAMNPTGGRGHTALPPGQRGLLGYLPTALAVGAMLFVGYFVLQFLGGTAKVPGTFSTADTAEIVPEKPPYNPVLGLNPATAGPSTPRPEAKAAPDRGAEQQALAFAKTKQGLAVSRADDAIRLADECQSEMAAFDARVQQLFADDDGKKIAGDPVQLSRFRAVTEKERPARDTAERMKRAANGIIAPIRAAHASAKDGMNPSEAVTEELDRLALQLAAVKRAWEQDRRAIDALVADAKRGARPASLIPLDQAVRAEADAEALALAKATGDERARVRAQMYAKEVKEAGELEQKIEEAKQAKLRAAKTAEADRLRTEAGIAAQSGKDTVADAKATAERERAREKAKAERDLQVKKANTPEVKLALTAFLTPSYHQPHQFFAGGQVDHVRTVKKEPISFGLLKTMGALDNKIGGLETLARIAGDKTDALRPRWACGSWQGGWSNEQQEMIQKAQDLLNELGPVMVEEGLLSK